MKFNPDTDKRHGIMYGLAYGDALGRPLEFITSKTLAKFGDPFRKQVGLNKRHQGMVTDDTQMSIAVARAIRTHGRPNPVHTADRLTREIVRWYRDPSSHMAGRAPGGTCMSAARKLSAGTAWALATDTDSKGNGANMRVAPLALRTDWTWDEMGDVAQLQAAITHGHATAMAASHLTAAAVRMLLEGVAKPNEQFLDHLIAYAWDQRSRYNADFLGHLWMSRAFAKPSAYGRSTVAAMLPLDWWDDAAGIAPKPKRASRGVVTSAQEFIERGWDKVIDCLDGIRMCVRDKQQDPCEIGGQGWTAEEALATSLHTLLCFPDDPTNALRRAAFTNGDSDSIASITGAMAGAAYGLQAFPSHWLPNLEYRTELTDLTADLTKAARSC